jgi:signal transduction histidine kinase
MQPDDKLPVSEKWWMTLSARLQQARDEERSAIGREFHDELGQVLAAVQMGVTALAEEYPDHFHLVRKIDELDRLLAGAVQTVQRISSQLWPAILNVLGLAESVQWQAREFQNRSGLACNCVIDIDESKIDMDTAAAVYRIFQECLTNIFRHSGAANVLLSLREKAGRLVLTVRDDGVGIAPDHIRNPRSLGILGIRERTSALGGRVKFVRVKPQGTAVIARIPLQSTAGETS